MIRTVGEYFIRQFKAVYTPLEKLSVDEGGMAWRGNLNFRVYNPNKPDKYMLKLYMLVEAVTGYIINFSLLWYVYDHRKDCHGPLGRPFGAGL